MSIWIWLAIASGLTLLFILALQRCNCLGSLKVKIPSWYPCGCCKPPMEAPIPACPVCKDCPTCQECPTCQTCQECPTCQTCQECPTCQTCEVCPVCPVAANTSANVPVVQPPLDKSEATTNTNDCDHTWQFPPNKTDADGNYWMFFAGTDCFVPGRSMTVEIPAGAGNCGATSATYGFAFLSNGPDPYKVTSFRFDINLGKNVIDFWNGLGGWPEILTTTAPNLSQVYFTDDSKMNQLKFDRISSTQTDLYINGVRMGSFNSPFPMDVGQIGIDAQCIQAPMYAKIK